MEFELTGSWVTGLIGGMILGTSTQIVIGIKEWVQTHAERKRVANYAALRVASILESFALACANKIDENNDYDSWFYQESKSNISLPQLASYPEDIDWKSLQPKLVAKSLSFPNEVMMGNQQIGFYASEPNACPDDGKDTSSLICGAQGFRAWILASELRAAYNLMEYRLDVGHYTLDLLNKYNDKYAEFKECETAWLRGESSCPI